MSTTDIIFESGKTLEQVVKSLTRNGIDKAFTSLDVVKEFAESGVQGDKMNVLFEELLEELGYMVLIEEYKDEHIQKAEYLLELGCNILEYRCAYVCVMSESPIPELALNYRENMCAGKLEECFYFANRTKRYTNPTHKFMHIYSVYSVDGVNRTVYYMSAEIL